MKKLVAIVLTVTLALGILLSGDCHAAHGHHGHHSREWAAAGGFLGGLVVGSAMSSRPYYYGGPYYYSYPVYSYPVYSTYGSCYSYPSYYTTYPSYNDYYWY